MANDIEFEDYTEDYLIEDCELYLIESASGITAVYGEVFDDNTATFNLANDPNQESSFDDTPDRIAKLYVPKDAP